MSTWQSNWRPCDSKHCNNYPALLALLVLMYVNYVSINLFLLRTVWQWKLMDFCVALDLDSGWRADLDNTDIIIYLPKENTEPLAACKINVRSWLILNAFLSSRRSQSPPQLTLLYTLHVLFPSLAPQSQPDNFISRFGSFIGWSLRQKKKKCNSFFSFTLEDNFIEFQKKK